MDLDRHTMVGYATSLLHAHQLRRENLYLNRQLKLLDHEVSTIKYRVDSVDNNTQNHNEELQKVYSAAAQCNAQLEVQGFRLDHLDDATDTLKTDLSSFASACNEYRRTEELSKKQLMDQFIPLLRDAQRTIDDQHKQAELLTESIKLLEHAMRHKVDQHVVDEIGRELQDLRENLPPPSSSLSRILDSVEIPTHSSSSQPLGIERMVNLDRTRKRYIQILDSQHRELCSTEVTGQEARKQTTPSKESRDGTTIPDDLDLDANADTISYAGHGNFAQLVHGPLGMLPELAVDPSELAKINALTQMRFETWASYRQRAEALLHRLPSAFAEVTLHQFVNGMFQDIQRRQCRQFLDSLGWTWNNVTDFGLSCSQLINEARPIETLAMDAVAELAGTNKDSDVKTRRPETTRKAINKVSSSVSPHETCSVRRSQRLIDREKREQSNRNGACIPGNGRNLQAGKTPGMGNKLVRRVTRVLETKDMHEVGRGNTNVRGGNSQLEQASAQRPKAQPMETNRGKAPQGSRKRRRPEAQKQKFREILPSPIGNFDEHNSYKPKLVPLKRPADSRADETASDEEHLPSMKHMITAQQKAEQDTLKQRCHRVPPPEIPILSTSSED